MIWYAVVRDDYDNDLGYGSTRKKEAAKMCRAMRKNSDKDAFIYVLRVNDGKDPEFIDLIKDLRGIR